MVFGRIWSKVVYRYLIYKNMNIQDCIIIPRVQLDRMEQKLDLLLTQSGKGGATSDYITADEVCEKLDIKKKTLYNWKSKGKIPFHKPEGSSKCYFRLQDIIAFQTGIKHHSNKELEAEAKTYLLNNK